MNCILVEEEMSVSAKIPYVDNPKESKHILFDFGLWFF